MNIELIISFALGVLTTIVVFIIKLQKDKYQTAFSKISNVLGFIEEFISNNQELFSLSWNKVKTKFQEEIEKRINVDIPDETWDFIFKLLYEKYKEIKSALKEEENKENKSE